MALPPERIEDVLPQADAAVVGVVKRIVEQATQRSYGPTPETSLPNTAARQVVELEVKSVLFGTLGRQGALVTVVKPEGAYALSAGNHGPFVLATTAAGVEIVGRYGPDTWPEVVVAQAAQRFGKR